MQYYVKIFNRNNNTLVGYYKETGRNCITRLKNGMKYWNNKNDAVLMAIELDNGFVRDKDGHYYSSFAVAYGDSKRQASKETRKTNQEKEEEIKDALDAFVRKNINKNA